MKKKSPDFAHIEPHQLDVHERLRNWARWVTTGLGRQVSPMFRLYHPPQHWEPKEFREPCDTIDAQRIEKLVCGLPKLFKDALRWYYVTPIPVHKICKLLGHRPDGLLKVVRDARQAVLNRLD